jgi:hypothetical protein
MVLGEWIVAAAVLGIWIVLYVCLVLLLERKMPKRVPTAVMVLLYLAIPIAAALVAYHGVAYLGYEEVYRRVYGFVFFFPIVGPVLLIIWAFRDQEP